MAVPTSSSSRRAGLVAGLAVLTALVAYAPSLGGPFFSDDFTYLFDSSLRSVPLTRPWSLLTTRTNRFEFLPVRDLSLRIDLAAFGDDPLGYRLHNLLLYGLSCLFLWLSLRALVAPALRSAAGGGETSDRAAWVATAATALFAAHPAHVESVAWVSGRKELLSGLLAFVSLWSMLRVIDAQDRRASWLAVSCAAFLLALLSKAAVAPLALFAAIAAADRARSRGAGGGFRWRAVLLVLPLVAVAAAAILLHLRVGTETGIVQAADGLPGGEGESRGALWLTVFGTLVRVALLPVDLRLVYDVQAPGSQAFVASLLGAAALATAVAAAYVLWKRPSIAALGVLAFASFSLPFLQLLPFRTWSYVSERFLFMPLMGIALCLAAAGTRWRAAAPMLLAAFALMVMGTAARSGDWASPETLMLETARASPADYAAVRTAVYFVWLPQGRYDEARRAVEAVRDEAGRRRLSRYVEAHQAVRSGDLARAAPLVRWLVESAPYQEPGVDFDLANMALEVGLAAEAAALYRSALERMPESRLARYNLGVALKRLGRYEEAAAEMQAAIDAGLREARVFNNLGVVCWQLRQMARAEAAFREALRSEPRHWHGGYNLARMFVEQGRVPEARDALVEARRRASASGDRTDPIDELLATLALP